MRVEPWRKLSVYMGVGGDCAESRTAAHRSIEIRSRNFISFLRYAPGPRRQVRLERASELPGHSGNAQGASSGLAPPFCYCWRGRRGASRAKAETRPIERGSPPGGDLPSA